MSTFSQYQAVLPRLDNIEQLGFASIKPVVSYARSTGYSPISAP